MVSAVPRDYFCEIDQNGMRRDVAERPELNRGAVDFAAPAEYQARPPLPPPLVVLLETTYASVTACVLEVVVGALRALLPKMAPHTRFALVTFNDSLHFYAGSETGLRQYCCPDVTEAVLPLPAHQLLLPIETKLSAIDQMLHAVPALFAGTKRPDAALGAAIGACHLLLEKTGGRLLVFQHTLPGIQPMKLTHRDDVRQYGTDKERALFAPVDASWTSLANQLSSAQICVSSFHFTAGNYVDIASQSTLARQTGGQVYMYANCVPEARHVWATKMQTELARNMLRDFGYEGVMRFRTSKGLRVEQYLMGQLKVGDVDIDMPGFDADSAFAVTFKLDDKLEESSTPCLQCALLYTTVLGERRIRVLTLGLQATSAMSSLYRYADLDALTNVLMRQAVLSSSKMSLHQARENIISTAINTLYNYRKTCAATTSAGQLILPESLKLLPLYALALTKSNLLRAGTEIRADERAALMAQAGRLAIVSSIAAVYPRLFALHNLTNNDCAQVGADGVPCLPATLPLSHEKLEPDGAFLLDDSVALYIWCGRGISQDFLQSVLQVSSLEGVDVARLTLVPLDNPISKRVHALINAIRSQRPHLMQSVSVLGPKAPLEARFLSMLIEDRAQASMSYVEFLCHVHRQIQNKFN